MEAGDVWTIPASRFSVKSLTDFDILDFFTPIS